LAAFEVFHDEQSFQQVAKWLSPWAMIRLEEAVAVTRTVARIHLFAIPDDAALALDLKPSLNNLPLPFFCGSALSPCIIRQKD
jgi:hypothetical protein